MANKELLVNEASCQLASQYNAGSGQMVVSLATYGTGWGQFPASLLTGGDYFRVQAGNIVFKVTAINTTTNQWTVTAVEGTDANVAAGTVVQAVASAGTLQDMHQLGQTELTLSDLVLSSVFPSGSSLPTLPDTNHPVNSVFFRTSDGTLWLNQAGTWTGYGGIGTPATGFATKTANYALTASDVGCIANAASLTITLPAAAGAGSGKRYTIKNGASGTGTTVVVSGGGTIDGASSFSGPSMAKDSQDFMTDGTTWYAV